MPIITQLLGLFAFKLSASFSFSDKSTPVDVGGTIITATSTPCRTILVQGTAHDGRYLLDSRKCNGDPVWALTRDTKKVAYIQTWVNKFIRDRTGTDGKSWTLSPEFCHNFWTQTCQGFLSSSKWSCSKHPKSKGESDLKTLGMPWEERMWVGLWWDSVEMSCGWFSALSLTRTFSRHTHKHTHTDTHTHTHAHNMQKHIRIYSHIPEHTQAFALACTNTQTHKYSRTHTYRHTHINTYIHTYIQTYTHKYIHTYIHTYTHPPRKLSNAYRPCVRSGEDHRGYHDNY